MFVITDKGLSYLDREFGNFRNRSDEGERKQSILAWLEGHGALTFDQVYDIVQRQREQMAQGELGYAPEGIKPDYYKTLLRLVHDGYVDVDLSLGN